MNQYGRLYVFDQNSVPTMVDAPSDFRSTKFAKTQAGQEEIKARALGLSPLARRLLVLIDGKRSGAELAPFAMGQDPFQLINELLTHGLVSAKTEKAVQDTPPPAATSAIAENVTTDWLAALPRSDSRSDQDREMARNFMTNTVNNIFGHHNRISLIEAIARCQSNAELRTVYAQWCAALETSSAGRKRLPELREKLFAVL